MRGLRRAQLCVAVVVLIMLAVGLVATSCSSAPPPADPARLADLLDKPGEPGIALIDLLPPGVPDEVAEMLSPAMLEEETDVWGHAAVRRPVQLADVAGGLPAVVLFEGRPVVGQLWRCQWVLDYVGPRVDRRCRLIVSQRDATPATIPGSRGAQLQVHPDLVLEPRGGALRQEGGVVTFSILWPHNTRGERWNVQLLVADDRTQSGVVVSPRVEVTVGNL